MRKLRNATLAILFAATFVFFSQPREVKAANDPSPRFQLLGTEAAGSAGEAMSSTVVSVFLDKATGTEWVCFRYSMELSCSMTGRKR